MRKLLSSHLTYANVASTLALVVALGGGGAAVAAGLAKNSVGSPQIRAGAVKTADLGRNSVTSAKVRNNALTGADLRESTLGKVPASGVADRAANLDFAVVEANGTLTRASDQGVTSSRVGAGSYRVIFPDDVSQCAPLGASGKIGNGTTPHRIVRTASLNANPNGIFVDMVDAAGAASDGGFVLYLLC